jgi:uncharacterized OsmC-like protein
MPWRLASQPRWFITPRRVASQIQEVESEIVGDIDPRGFRGLDKNVRNGFQDTRMAFGIKADVPDGQLEELARLGPQFSPVFHSVTNGVPVTISAARMYPLHQ